MPREYLTDDMVLKKCMETYPIPFGTSDKLLDVGTNVKTKEGFTPFRPIRRRPNPPNRQIFLANALVNARKQIGAKPHLEEANKIREKVLKARPDYPEYVREPKSNIDEMIEQELSEMDDDEELSEEVEAMIEKEVAELNDDDDIVKLDKRQKQRLNQLLNQEDDDDWIQEQNVISVEVLPSGELQQM